MTRFIVVFDTCILRSDHEPESALWVEFRELRKHNPVSVSIPEVVFKEFNSFKSEPERKKVEDYNKAIKLLTKEGEGLANLGLLDDAMLARAQEAVRHLKDVSAGENSVQRDRRTRQILSAIFGRVDFALLPKVTHYQLIDRCQAHRKPFTSDKGYKDALIWYSILELLDANPKACVAFVSSNIDDFADSGKKKLHEDLAKDLSEEQRERFKYFTSLKELLESDLISRPQRRDDLLQQLQASSDLERALLEAQLQFIRDLGVPLFTLFSRLNFGALIVSLRVRWFVLLSIDEVSVQIGSGDYIVTVKLSIGCELERYKDLEQKNQFPQPVPPDLLPRQNVAAVVNLRVHYEPNAKAITAFSSIGVGYDPSWEGFLRVRTPTPERPEYGVAVVEPVNLSDLEFLTTDHQTFKACLRDLGVEESAIPSIDEVATLGAFFAPCMTNSVLKKWQLLPSTHSLQVAIADGSVVNLEVGQQYHIALGPNEEWSGQLVDYIGEIPALVFQTKTHERIVGLGLISSVTTDTVPDVPPTE